MTLINEVKLGTAKWFLKQQCLKIELALAFPGSVSCRGKKISATNEKKNTI